MATDVFPGATLIQLVEFGYPMGSLRPAPSTALAFSVIHITANLASAQNELAWRRDDPGLQNSATFFVNRDGSIWQALADPFRMDPWTNGDVNGPDFSNPRIAAVVQDGVNANERSFITIENVGREPYDPITPAQVEADGQLIAYYHAKLGLPINRETVIGHYQINSVDRPNCPSTDKSIIDRVIAAAGGNPMNTPGMKLAGSPIGTFEIGPGHALIKTADTTEHYQDWPGGNKTFAVIAAIDLKSWPAGDPVDIEGNSPPLNNRDQVYLVSDPNFGCDVYALRQDGVFTPTATADCSPVEAQLAAAQGALAGAEADLAKAEAIIEAAASGLEGLLA